MQYLNIKNTIVKISNISIFNKYNLYIYINVLMKYIYIYLMQYIYICFNFMIFNNTRNFNKYLLWLFYCIFNYNLKIIIKYIKCIYT